MVRVSGPGRGEIIDVNIIWTDNNALALCFPLVTSLKGPNTLRANYRWKLLRENRPEQNNTQNGVLVAVCHSIDVVMLGFHVRGRKR
jgi:hypothetical protein